MGRLVKSYKRDGLGALMLLLIPIGVIVLLISISNRGDSEDRPLILDIIHVPFILLSLVLYIAVMAYLKPLNQAIDQKIVAHCAQYSDSAVGLQYITSFTGLCKPKGAQIYRGLYITPNLQMSGASSSNAMPTQMLQVTCPPGVKAGEPFQIATPSGPMQAIVPAGISEGMVFHLQVAAQPMPVVAAQAVVISPA